MIASIPSAVLSGVDGRPVRVEVHVANGLPGFTVVGLPDAAVRESRDRVRAAFVSTGLPWPRRRITVNLAPSGVRKGGAGLDLPIAARRLAKSGVVGFEWAVGVPGTFGGAVVMNAGGHGSDMNASVHSLVAWSRRGTRTWTHDELAFRYRGSALGRGDLVTNVTLHLAAGDAEAAQEEIREVVRWRRANQPGGANAGSAFRNPEGDYAGRLIEAAGCKGLRIGTAVVSEKHANFIIADAAGRANDVYELLLTVRQRVLDRTGVSLTSEHRFLGFEAVP